MLNQQFRALLFASGSHEPPAAAVSQKDDEGAFDCLFEMRNAPLNLIGRNTNPVRNESLLTVPLKKEIRYALQEIGGHILRVDEQDVILHLGGG